MLKFLNTKNFTKHLIYVSKMHFFKHSIPQHFPTRFIKDSIDITLHHTQTVYLTRTRRNRIFKKTLKSDYRILSPP